MSFKPIWHMGDSSFNQWHMQAWVCHGRQETGTDTHPISFTGRHVDPDAVMGSIRVNGQLKDQRTFARVVG